MQHEKFVIQFIDAMKRLERDILPSLNAAHNLLPG